MWQTLRQKSQDDATIRELENIYDCVVASERIVVISGQGISCLGGGHSSKLPKLQIVEISNRSFCLKDTMLSASKGVGRKGLTLKVPLRRDWHPTPEQNKVIGELREMIATVRVTDAHGFFWVLHCKHKLQRIYTQIVDAMESRLGIPAVKFPNHTIIHGGYVALQGDFTQLRCSHCSETTYFSKLHVKCFQSGTAPSCPSCIAKGG